VKSHPRNEGTSGVDLAILLAMPGAIAVLLAMIAYLALEL
jgi:hypothetical protein